MPSYHIDLIDLARRLKHEKLFVSNERKEIEALNKKVQFLSTDLLHQTWLTGQNRFALEKFTRSSITPEYSFFTIPNSIGSDVSESLELIDVHKHICPKYLHSYVDLISLLRSHPDIVGLCLSTYEDHYFVGNSSTSITFRDVLQAIVNIYGGIGGPLPADGTLHLKLLSVLAGLQLLGPDPVHPRNPRRVLNSVNCAFSSLYRIISETIPSSRLFLVGALHQPITHLLSSQELISLGNNVPAMSPLSSNDHPIVESSNAAVNQDIASLDKTEKMAQLTKMFIESILDNIHAFPTGLAWLIKSIHTQLIVTVSTQEVSQICTDLIWGLFICPAVTNPEPFGVTDAPVGSQARHTLAQVARILQALAHYRWKGSDQSLNEYISYFDPECLSSILDHVLSLECLPTEQSIASGLSRRTVLIPENLLQPLFIWLKESLVLLEQNGKLTDLEIWPTLVKLTTTVNENISQGNSTQSTSNLSNSNPSVGSNSNLSDSSSTQSTSSPHTPNFLMNGRRHLMNRFGSNSNSPRPESKPLPSRTELSERISVIVIPVTQQPWEWVGMSSEAEVVAAGKKLTVVGPADVVDPLVGIEDAEDEEREDRGSIGEKRTRFSLSHDDGSIGTSDNLEAVSEAASTHSVSSSIELEDQNDNLSDMLSANVSGRGTPNVSGRNTPQEEADESGMGDEVDGREVDNEDVVMGDDGNEEGNREPEEGNVNPPNLNNLNIHGHQMPDPAKQARSEIQDKFCKFEIRKAMFGGDETNSLVSDTWSTDVLASDSEMGGENSNQLSAAERSQIRSNARYIGVPNSIVDRVVDISAVGIADSNPNNETMSEAWSTDVAANDIERLHDFDNDDTLSVSRSDDTGRSELESVSYDTPRSSVSGRGENYMQRRDEPLSRDLVRDLLLFNDEQVENNTDAIALPPPPRSPNELDDVQDQPMNEMNQNVSVDQEILVPEIVDPSISSSLGLNLLNSLSSSGNGIGSNSLPGTSRSGAIPKTISFDKTAERGDRESWDEESGRTKRFFRNFRLPFRGRSRKSRGHDERFEWEASSALSVTKLKKSLSEDLKGPTPSTSEGIFDLQYSNELLEENWKMHEILDKYRRKPSLTNSTNGGPILPRSDLNVVGNIPKHSIPQPIQGNPPVIVRKESLKITRAELVHDARKKLRNVLSNCDLQFPQNSDGITIDNLLINLLRVEVASAISRSDQVMAAQLQEAIRTIKQLGVDGCRKVLRLLRDDYRRRSEFISYLMRAKQGLLSTIQFLERSTVRAKHEGDTYSHYLVTECVRLWLEDSGYKSVEKFITEFRSLKAVDEKIELLEGFLYHLLDKFMGMNGGNFTEWQLSKMESAIEQIIVSKIYLYALYPNDDADVHRDAVFKEHITRLESVVTPSHRYLRIPKSHLGECPWPPAQRELKMLSAYKTPSDKLRCIVRACSLIVNLLSSSSEKVVAADDFVPVLVYVIIKTNPPALLSTIQYVNSFYGQKISGEDQYWWVQFCSAVEFIKTMEYNMD